MNTNNTSDTDPTIPGARPPDAPDHSDSRRPSAPSYGGALVIGGAAALLLVTLLVVALTNPDRGAHRHEEAPRATGDAPMIGHIHGVAAYEQAGDPADETVLVGAHYGLFAVDADGSVERVGNSTADYMALTGAEPGRLLASGHPELTDMDQPVNLGLMESLDGGRSWEALSLEGAADFHALEHTPQRTWGVDSVTGGLMTSTDERIWQTVHGQPLLDLAVDPDDPDQVLATAADGQLLAITAAPDAEGAREVKVDGAPRMAFIDWPTSDVLVGVGAEGVVWRSDDGGESWGELATVSGEPTALSVVAGSWFVATSDGLFRGPIDADGSSEDVDQVLVYSP